jgi:tetratricopeptide (TPR) repeat protein
MFAFTVILFLFFAPPVFSVSTPEWFIPLRDAIYEQELKADEIVSIYREVSNIARSSLSGHEQHIMLSRCEYMMGRAYLFEERKDEAAVHFENGMAFAQRALDARKTAEAWVMLAENLSQLCTIRPVSFVMANGLNIERYAKNALAIDSRNAAAQYLIAARWVYAPAPFHNHRRGIEMMNAIITGSNFTEKDDIFNVHLSIAYAHLQQRNNALARTWLLKAIEIYPTNKYARSLFDGLR